MPALRRRAAEHLRCCEEQPERLRLGKPARTGGPTLTPLFDKTKDPPVLDNTDLRNTYRGT
jgi:hypothetical protein